MHVIGVFNRDGGTFKTTDMEAYAARAVEIFGEHGHELEARIVEGKDLIAELERAAADGEVVLAGGGDGTISAAAGIAYKTGKALGVIPAGTMNLFARSLQVPLDINEALAAIAAGEITAVDIATANGRPFVHQFSVGIHAKLVKLRETLTYKSRIGKMVASMRAFIGAIAHAPNFHADVTTRGRLERRATAGISVSNNALEGALPHANRLDAGVLGIYVIAPLNAWIVTRLAWAALLGRWKTLPEVNDREAREVTLRFPRRKRNAVAVIDGELVELEPTVELRIHPRALKVMMPRVEPDAAPEAAEITLTPA